MTRWLDGEQSENTLTKKTFQQHPYWTLKQMMFLERLRKGHLKKETAGFLIASQDEVIWRREVRKYVNFYILVICRWSRRNVYRRAPRFHKRFTKRNGLMTKWLWFYIENFVKKLHMSVSLQVMVDIWFSHKSERVTVDSKV